MTGTLSRGILFAIGMVLCAAAAQAQTYAAVVMDGRTGKVIHAINPDVRVHPASLTKMMTLYITFDQLKNGRLSLDDKAVVSARAASEPPSRLGLRAGQEIEVRYLIRAAAIKSANDAATTLAETIGGSVPNFAKLMTAYARAMGMNDTTFRNANGLTLDGHMSSARDMALLGRRLVYDFPQYYNIFSRNSTSAGIATVRNTNRRLLDAYPGADGIKTGYTKAAGFNLVSSAKRGDKRVIVALLGGKSSAARNAEVARLMDLGFAKMPNKARQVPLASLRTNFAALARPAVVPAAVETAAALDEAGPAGNLPGMADAGSDEGAGAEEVASEAGAATAPRTTAVTISRGSAVGLAVADGAAAVPGEMRPRPRAAAFAPVEVARQRESIAAAITEVNEELAAAQDAVRELGERPAPRPAQGAAREADIAAVAGRSAGSASTFIAGPAAPRAARESGRETVEVASNANPGTTGGNDWGVQLGAFRAKGEAERQLLTTALQDVPDLAGGLRRVEAASVGGVTVYRAQFVGLSQSAATGACAALARMDADCMPLAPGI